MRYTESIDKSQQISKKALARIEQENLPPKPHIFELWYTYQSGLYPEIQKEIDERSAAGDSITEKFCEDLYDKYLSSDHEKQVIEDTTEKVFEALGEISSIIRSAGAMQNDYNKELEQAHNELTGPDAKTDPDDIKLMVESLVKETRSMLEENQKLENQLHKSSIEMQEMRQTMETLQRDVMTDTLTGLPNRKCFDTELKMAAAEAMDKNAPLSLIMCDIDHFKTFNDTFGHQVGDQVLRLVARSLVEGIKGQDLAARFGGEEFIIILPHTQLTHAERVAEGLRKRIAAKDIINQAKGEKLGRLTISLGVAEFHPGEPLYNLVERVDQALYKAKDAGRDTVVTIAYDPKLHSRSEENNNILIDVEE